MSRWGRELELLQIKNEARMNDCQIHKHCDTKTYLLKVHFGFFGKPYCQRENWRGRSQHFKLAKPGQNVTCASCRKFATVGR